MIKRENIVVIGGNACGPKAAARACRLDAAARITIIEQGDNLSTATCGLPYYISGEIAGESSLIARQPSFFRDVLDIDILIKTRAQSIDRKKHEVEVVNLENNQLKNITYDKLVLATGSVPVIPELEGINLKGIFTLSKIKDASAIRSFIASLKTREVTVIGAGLIGLEMGEAFATQGLKVTVVEALGRVLPALLDFEIAAQVEKHLRSHGVKLLFRQRVIGFDGDAGGNVRRVITNDSKFETGLVLLAIGFRPEVSLAREAGLTIGSARGILVDEHLRTSDPYIYAGGDCVENLDLITGKKVLAFLGSTANKHGRVIGSNVTGGDDTFPGVLGTAITKVFDFNVGRVGLSEVQAQEAGFKTVTSIVPGNEHATYYPGSREIMVKLVAEKSSCRLLGGQVVGPGDAAKRIDVLATALSFSTAIADLANLDLAYAPPYNSAMDPLHNAANVIRNKQSGYARSLTPMEVRNKLEKGEDFILLDVRSPAEWQASRIEAWQVKVIPLPELRKKLKELPEDKEIVTFCRTSVRAYQAQRILEGAGFTNTKFMDGSITAWPYEKGGKLSETTYEPP